MHDFSIGSTPLSSARHSKPDRFLVRLLRRDSVPFGAGQRFDATVSDILEYAANLRYTSNNKCSQAIFFTSGLDLHSDSRPGRESHAGSGSDLAASDRLAV